MLTPQAERSMVGCTCNLPRTARVRGSREPHWMRCWRILCCLTLHFSVAEDAPRRRKLALVGSLQAADVGIALHQPISVSDCGNSVLVSHTPVNVDPCHRCGFGDVRASSLVLIPYALPLAAILGTRMWNVKDTLHLTIRDWPNLFQGAGPAGEVLRQASVQALASARGLTPSSMPDDMKALWLASLSSMRDSRDLVQFDGRAWKLSIRGRASLCASATLESPTACMKVHRY